MIIVGVAGALEAGKDTIANYMVRRYGFVRRAFADSLKEEVLTRMQKTLRAYTTAAYWRDDDGLIHDLIWVKKDAFSRAILQEWGTELRRQDDPDYWIKRFQAWAHEHQPQRVVVSDTRFENEAVTILGMGGYLVRVTRPGRTGDTHQSERDLDHWTLWAGTFQNDGTIADLEAKVDEWVANTLPWMVSER